MNKTIIRSNNNIDQIVENLTILIATNTGHNRIGVITTLDRREEIRDNIISNNKEYIKHISRCPATIILKSGLEILFFTHPMSTRGYALKELYIDINTNEDLWLLNKKEYACMITSLSHIQDRPTLLVIVSNNNVQIDNKLIIDYRKIII